MSSPNNISPNNETTSNKTNHNPTPEKEFKKMIHEKLTNYTWHQNQVIACKAYIENNGTKTTTLEEIRDFLLPDAIKNFPIPVRDEMIDKIQGWYEKFLDHQAAEIPNSDSTTST